MVMVWLRWLPHWQAYAVFHRCSYPIGLVRCLPCALPFRVSVEFV